MAEMVAVLGPPPLDYLPRTETSWEYFDNTGNGKGAVEIPDISLEDSYILVDSGHLRTEMARHQG